MPALPSHRICPGACLRGRDFCSMHVLSEVFTLILLLGCVGPLDVAQLICQGQCNVCVCVWGDGTEIPGQGLLAPSPAVPGWYYQMSTICLSICVSTNFLLSM